MVRQQSGVHSVKKSMESRDIFVYTNLAIYGIKISGFYYG